VGFSLLGGFATPSLVGTTIVFLYWLKSASATQRGIEIEKWFNKIGTPD
jgi:hypothetical protein